jgi:CRP-like cAMP-binding protein
MRPRENYRGPDVRYAGATCNQRRVSVDRSVPYTSVLLITPVARTNELTAQRRHEFVAGALIGAVSLFARRFTMPAATQALVDAELLRLSPAVVRRAVARDTRVAQAFLSELSERVLSFVDEIPGNTFTTVRQRVARHLLEPRRAAGT